MLSLALSLSLTPHPPPVLHYLYMWLWDTTIDSRTQSQESLRIHTYPPPLLFFRTKERKGKGRGSSINAQLNSSPTRMHPLKTHSGPTPVLVLDGNGCFIYIKDLLAIQGKGDASKIAQRIQKTQ